MRFLSSISAFFSLGFDSIRSGLGRGVITKVVCYALFGCLTFSVFLGLHVAEDELERSFYEVVGNVKAVCIEPEGVELSLLPPRMKLNTLLLSDAQKKSPLYEMHRVVITPSYSALFSGKAELNLTSASYGGGVRLVLSSGTFFDTEKVNVDLKILQQSLDRIPFMTAFDSQMKGTGDVHLTYSGSPQNFQLGSGTLEFNGKELRITNQLPLVKVSVFDKIDMTGVLAYNNGKLKIQSLKLKGKPVNGELQGTASLNWKNPYRSNVKLLSSFYVKPDKLVQTLVDNNSLKKLKAGKRVKIAIDGQLRNPRFALK